MPDDAPTYPNPPRPPRGPNDRSQLETVSRNRQIVQSILKDPEALALAAARDRDAAYFAAGTALADAYLTDYGERDDATGTQTGARTTLKAADRDARTRYDALRALLRDEYADQPEHLERLGVTAPRAAADRDTFLEEARATVAAARKAPYAAAIAPAGWPAKELDALGTALDALETAAGTKTGATATHTGSTADRDAAYAAFMAWMKKARRRLDIAYKEHPAVAARLGL